MKTNFITFFRNSSSSAEQLLEGLRGSIIGRTIFCMKRQRAVHVAKPSAKLSPRQVWDELHDRYSKIEMREKPAATVDFESDDGKLFKTAEDCLSYELKKDFGVSSLKELKEKLLGEGKFTDSSQEDLRAANEQLKQAENELRETKLKLQEAEDNADRLHQELKEATEKLRFTPQPYFTTQQPEENKPEEQPEEDEQEDDDETTNEGQNKTTAAAPEEPLTPKQIIALMVENIPEKGIKLAALAKVVGKSEQALGRLIADRDDIFLMTTSGKIKLVLKEE